MKGDVTINSNTPDKNNEKRTKKDNLNFGFNPIEIRKSKRQEEFLKYLIIFIIPTSLGYVIYNTVFHLHSITVSYRILIVTIIVAVFLTISYLLNMKNYYTESSILTLFIFEVGALLSIYLIPVEEMIIFDYLIIPVVLSIILFPYYVSIFIFLVNIGFLFVNILFVFPPRFDKQAISSIQFQFFLFALIMIYSYMRNLIEKDHQNEIISQQKELNQKLRLEALGKLVSGVAHDFNNILSGMISNSELLLLSNGDIDEYKDYIKQIRDGGFRASSLIKKLLSFSKVNKANFRILNVHTVLKNLVDVMKRTFPKNITIEYNPSTLELYILGDEDQLYNAFLNICINARDAIPNGGTIIIQTGLHSLSENPEQPFEKAVISISDTGEGIPENIKDKIFEPFFSTKSQNKGVGLGLSSVYGTIKNHGGKVTINSSKKFGSEFVISLPIDPRNESKHTSNTDDLDFVSSKQDLSIMIIDDDHYVLEGIKLILKHSGYRILDFDTALKGIEYFDEHYTDIDLILLDINMPEISGVKAYNSLMSISRVPVIIITGFLDEATREKLTASGVEHILSKPFSVSQLHLTIAEVIKEENLINFE